MPKWNIDKTSPREKGLLKLFDRFIRKGQKGQIHSVLIIEDNPTDLLFAGAVLQKANYYLWLAQDGETGLRVAGAKRPDVILLDCLLPGISGLEVCRAIKADSSIKHIPVVFLSIIEDGLTLLECYEAGANAFVLKPIKPKQLLAEIEMAIEEGGEEGMGILLK